MEVALLKRFQEELNSNIVTNQLIDFIKSN